MISTPEDRRYGRHPQFGAAPHILCGCGRPVETPRLVYAIPTCYACLPPPEPLPVAAQRAVRS